MREIQRIRKSLVACAFAALSFTAAGAPVATPVLGSDGEVYRLVRTATESGDPYLVLSIQRPDGSTESHTVPDTEGAGGESSPHLVYENASRTVFLTWEERFNQIHSLIRLVGFQNGAWTDVIEVSEGSFSFKGEPRLAATQDSYVVGDADGATRTVTRTILHVVWVEEHGAGQMVAYSPVTLLDGHYVGQRRIFDLSSILSGAEPLPTDLWQLARPTVATAADDHSVVVGLIDPHTGRVASLRIAMLPGELSMVADELRSHLIDVGARHEWQSPEGLQRLADELRSHLIDVGHRLDPQILHHVADGLRSHLIDVGARYAPSDVRRMAGDLRSHLIDVGFRLNDSGLRQATAAALSQAVIEVAAVGEGDEASLTTQVARVTVVDDWSRPAEAHSDSVLLVSRSGNAALLHWTEGQTVLYRETFGGEWGSVVRLPRRDASGTDEALELLQNRIRNR